MGKMEDSKFVFKEGDSPLQFSKSLLNMVGRGLGRFSFYYCKGEGEDKIEIDLKVNQR